MTLLHLVFMRLCFGRGAAAGLPKPRLARQLALLGPMSAAEKGALVGFLFFLLGAATSDWHHVSAAWIAGFLLVGLLLMGLFSKKDFQQKIDWPMIFFLLSLDGLSRSISYLGLDTALAHSVGNGFAFVDGRSHPGQRIKTQSLVRPASAAARRLALSIPRPLMGAEIGIPISIFRHRFRTLDLHGVVGLENGQCD